MLEPVREYGLAALARRADQQQRTRAGHAEHYAGLAQRCDVGLRREDRSRHLLTMCREEDNLLAALAWAREHDRDLALRLATALAYFCELHGLVNDGRAWLSGLLDSGAGDERTRGEASARLGRLAWRQGDNDGARRYFGDGLSLARSLGDRLRIATGLRNLALVECSAGNGERALELSERSVKLHAELDDVGRGWAWTVLALAKATTAQWADCDRASREALAANRVQRSTALEATARIGIAFAAANTGDTATHRAHLRVLLADIGEAGELVDDSDWLWSASGLACNEGRFRASLRLAGAARAVSERGCTMPLTTMPFTESCLERARQQLGRRSADRLMRQGTAMTTEQLIAEALQQPTAGDRPLSPREREVAELVGDGKTNEQIAAALVLSRRTVESHVESLKTKPALGGRNELMAWVLARRFDCVPPR
ncbi:LuxR C-terminal-related transcriptional regulator [Saccharopolyspora rhizosphaerae]|nr:LuxR C-terminal-related transcriptional regulator [Saccharopolyspora rhizosphaerae]